MYNTKSLLLIGILKKNEKRGKNFHKHVEYLKKKLYFL